jgi:outer membrane receptor protein involved in Fe transport
MSSRYLIIALLAGYLPCMAQTQGAAAAAADSTGRTIELCPDEQADFGLDGDDLRLYPIAQIEDVLTLLPGVSLSFDRVSLALQTAARGFGSIPLRLDHTLLDATSTPLVAFDRVGVRSSPWSTPLRSTLAPSVGVATSSGTDLLRARLSGSLDGAGRGELFASVGLGRVGATLYGSHLFDPGLRQHSERSTTVLGAAVRWLPADRLALRLSLNGEWSRAELPGPLPEEALAEPMQSSTFFRFDRLEGRAQRASLELGWIPADDIAVGVTAAAEIGRASSIHTVPLSNDYADTRRRDVDGLRLDVSAFAAAQFRLFGITNRVELALDATRRRDVTTYTTIAQGGEEHYYAGIGSGAPDEGADGTAHRDRVRASARFDTEPIDGIRVSAGADLDHYRDGFSAWADSTPVATRELLSPWAGTTVRYFDDGRQRGSVYATIARSYRAPALDELYDRRPYPTFGPPYTRTLSNPELAPERAMRYEIGLRHGYRGSGGASAELLFGVYRIDVADAIGLNLDGPRVENLADGRHEGIEIGLSAHLDSSTSLFASYARQEAHYLGGANDGGIIAGIPRDVGALGVSYVHWTGLGASMIARGSGKVYLDDERVHSITSHVVVDTRLSYRWGATLIAVDCYNLFDASYELDGFVDPVGAGAAYFHPGNPRSIFLTLGLEL